MKLRKIMILMSALSIFSAFFLVTLTLFWEFYPYKVLVFNTPLFILNKKTIKAGQNLTYTSNYCKYIDLPATVGRVFSNDLIFSTPAQSSNRPMGCHSITVAVIVPHELPPGKYRLENVYEFKVNPIRTIVVKENTEEFNVIE
jgi:hypothetical protein